MRCNYCSEEIIPGSTFCKNCGSPVDMNYLNQQIQQSQQIKQNSNTNDNNIKKKKNQNTNKIIKITIIVVIIIFAIIIIKNTIYQIKLHIVEKQVSENAKKLGDEFDHKFNTYTDKKDTYTVGTAVTLIDGSKWHMINRSDNTVILLSDILVSDKIGYGNSGNPENQKYINSNVKTFVEETYLPKLKQSINNYNGDTTNLSARLLTSDEYLKLTGQTYSNDFLSSQPNFNSTEDQDKNKKFLSLTDSFWTMSNIRDNNPNSKFYGAYAILVNNGYTSLYSDYSAQEPSYNFVGASYSIRPVIETTIDNLK